MKLLVFTISSMFVLTGAARADLSISNKPTQNMSCNAGICTATAKGANLNVGDLTNMLASGDATVKTGGGAITIQVLDGFSWTSSSRLTLDANHSIGIHQPVVLAANGAVTITTNDGGSGGDLQFFDNGKMDFSNLSSGLIINGNSYTLVRDIKTLAQAITSGPSGLYALAQDYDAFADGTYKSAVVVATQSGVFEGLGHTISNVQVSGYNSDGAFFLRASGLIRDISVSNARVVADGNAGILLAYGNATLVGCQASGSVVSRLSDVGGLVGYLSGGVVRRSNANARVKGADQGGATAGGLIGWALDAQIANSYATGTVRRGDDAGGLVGHNEFTDISYSHSSAAVLDSMYYAGGLVGTNLGSIYQSYATGKVSSTRASYVGGLVGAGSSGVSSSYSRGDVHASDVVLGVGGSSGEMGGAQISDTYATGKVNGGTSETRGGFVGVVEQSYPSNDYWDTTTSGEGRRHRYGSCIRYDCHRQEYTGLSTEQFLSGLPPGFDPRVWGQSPKINNGYPYLLANPPQ